MDSANQGNNWVIKELLKSQAKDFICVNGCGEIDEKKLVLKTFNKGDELEYKAYTCPDCGCYTFYIHPK